MRHPHVFFITIYIIHCHILNLFNVLSLHKKHSRYENQYIINYQNMQRCNECEFKHKQWTLLAAYHFDINCILMKGLVQTGAVINILKKQIVIYHIYARH